jgi:hypothetical protein
VALKLFQKLKLRQKHKKIAQNKKLSSFDKIETKRAHLNYSLIKPHLRLFPINVCFPWPAKTLHRKVTVQREEKHLWQNLSINHFFAQLVNPYLYTINIIWRQKEDVTENASSSAKVQAIRNLHKNKNGGILRNLTQGILLRK